MLRESPRAPGSERTTKLGTRSQPFLHAPAGSVFQARASSRRERSDRPTRDARAGEEQRKERCLKLRLLLLIIRFIFLLCSPRSAPLRSASPGGVGTPPPQGHPPGGASSHAPLGRQRPQIHRAASRFLPRSAWSSAAGCGMRAAPPTLRLVVAARPPLGAPSVAPRGGRVI